MAFLGKTLRFTPAARLVAAAEVLLLARRHILKLEPQERQRVIQLVRQGRGRPGQLSERERRELAELVRKAEPRQFVMAATKKVSGFPLPGTKGSRRKS